MTPHASNGRLTRMPSARNSILIGLAAVLACALAAPQVARAHPDGSYPRVTNLDWNNTINAYYMSRYDVVSLSTRLQNNQLDSLRALNPSIRRLVSTSWYIWFFAGPSGFPYQWGPYNATDPVYGYDRKFWDLMQNNDWWMYARDSSGVKYHASMAFNMWMGNFSSHCPKRAGKRLCDVYADFLADNLLTQRHIDGVFFDYTSRGIAWMNWYMWGNCPYNQNCLDPNVEHTPDTKFHTAFDSDNNGTPDQPDSLDKWWREGMDIVFANLRTRMGQNFIMVGNGNHSFTGLNGAMIENFPFILGSADPWPNPYGYKWNSNMFSTSFGYLGQNEILFQNPRYNMNLAYTSDPANTIFEPNRTPTRERHKRFTLASTLMGDGYYGINGIGNQWYWWEPEFDLNLGYPVGPALRIDLGSGTYYWVRTFTNGTVYLNPTGWNIPAQGTRPAINLYDAVIQQALPLAADPAPSRGPVFDTPSPNPMRAQTYLRFTLPADAPATLQIFDARGRLLRDVWTGMGTGAPQTAEWDGDTNMGLRASTGIYFARLTSREQSVQRTIVRMP